MSRGSVLQELANRAAVELARVAAARPALSSRCERAVGILAAHASAPRSGAIKGQLRGGGLTGYLVRGSGGAVYRVEAKGSWRCSCPDHHGRHRQRGSSRACKHALAVWALWRAASGALAPAVEGLAPWSEFDAEAERWGVEPRLLSREVLAAMVEGSVCKVSAPEHRKIHQDAGDFARWGRRGGLRTLARVRWGRLKVEALVSYREAVR